MLPELDPQLDQHEAKLLRAVLADLVDEVGAALGDDLVGVYLMGSFALGAGDIHADVDFLVVTAQELSGEQCDAVREIHAKFPDRPEHWTRVLEGSYATRRDLNERADPSKPWLYVDNGAREMELSGHDNTEVSRWVLKHRGLTVVGPAADSLLDAVPAQALRAEAAALAVHRAEDALSDPAYLENGWGQPHEVLTQCRMLYTSMTGQVAGKSESTRWCLQVLPEKWHDLLRAADASRPDPWQRVLRKAAPGAAELTARFIRDVTPRIVAAAHDPVER